MPELLVKSIPFQVAEVKTVLKKREWEGYASTFGNMDSYGDIIEPGAFRKTISERGPHGTGQIKALWEHWEPFGKIIELSEDGNGLWMKGRATDTAENQDRLKYMDDGVVDSMSIGFSIPEGKSWWEDDMHTRHIEEVKLYEVSAVMFPANELAVVSNVRKSAELNRLLKTVSADDLLAELRSKELNLDPRRIEKALDLMEQARVELFGTVEEKKALGQRVEPSDDTPETTPEPPAEVKEDDLKDEEKEAVDYFRSALDQELIRDRLSSAFS